MEKVEIITKDDVKIVGDFYPVSPLSGGRRGSALLLHMMPATKESWEPLARRLVGAGIQVLAIDLRGHGESTSDASGKALDYRNFSDEQHQAKRFDVAAAAEWLAGERGAVPGFMVVGGASIGANLALRYAADEPSLAGAFALSPGLDYHGVKTQESIERLADDQRILLAASEDDTQESWEAVEQLSASRPHVKTFKFAHAGHGTTMFEREPQFLEDVADWVQETLTPKSDV